MLGVKWFDIFQFTNQLLEEIIAGLFTLVLYAIYKSLGYSHPIGVSLNRHVSVRTGIFNNFVQCFAFALYFQFAFFLL